MGTLEVLGTKFTAGEADASFSPANENLRLICGGMTLAEGLQIIHRMKEQLRRKFAANSSFRSDPQDRRDWDITLGMEKIWRRLYGGR